MNFITRLETLAAQYIKMGKYAEAEPLYQEALEIQREAFDETHPAVAKSLNDLAMLYRDMGKLEAAEPFYKQAIEIQRTVHGKNHPEVARDLTYLATLYYDMGNYAMAEPLLQEALEIRRISLGEGHPEVATSLQNLAVLYRAMGRYNTAELLFQQALESRRTALGEDQPEFAATLSELGRLYYDIGDYAAAESLCRQALELQCTSLGERHPEVAESLSNLAAIYLSLGDYTAAEPLCRQALEIRRISLGEGHPKVATSLQNLAVLYRVMGNYAAALPLYEQALEILRMSSKRCDASLVPCLSNLAWLYRAMGDNELAVPIMREAREIVDWAHWKDHRTAATIQLRLALLYHDIGVYEIAKMLYQQALESRRTALGEDQPEFATTLSELGRLYYDIGDYAAAESLCRQALELQCTSLGERHPEVAESLSNLARLYHTMGRYSDAELLYQQALEIRGTTPEAVLTFVDLAILYTATNRPAEALALLKEAAVIEGQMIGQIFSVGSENQRMAYLKGIQVFFHTFISLILQYLSHSPAAVQAGLELVLRRKSIGAEALATQNSLVLSGRYPSLEPKLQALTTLRVQIAQKALTGPGPEDFEPHQQQLAKWNIQKERLEAELTRQIPEMNLECYLHAADQQAIANALPQGVALVEFVRSNTRDFHAGPVSGRLGWKPAHYLAFVIHAGALDDMQMIDLGEAEPIDQMIAKFRVSITSANEWHCARHLVPITLSQGTSVSDGATLRAAVFDPLLAALGACKRFFLSLDGDLAWLPFEVLPTQDGHSLIDDYHISYLSVGRDLLRFGAAPIGQPTDPLIVADPDFDLGSDGVDTPVGDIGSHGQQSRGIKYDMLYFNHLPGTREEGKQIADMLGVKPRLQGSALKAYLKTCRSPHIIHLATHGFFLENQQCDPNTKWRYLLMRCPIRGEWFNGGMVGRLSGLGLENPMLRSGLALAGANTWLKKGKLPVEAENGILTAEDVSGLNLHATELAVLSACETGLGEVQIGEGVLGLRRAFVLAGAKTLVMSLWKVPDQHTQELMVDFYRRILQGQPWAAALREAQLAMKAKYPHPFYWGAFICQGDPGPLLQHRGTNGESMEMLGIRDELQ